MGRKAIYDATGILKSHGFCAFVAEAGETVRDVPDEYGSVPGQVQWNGTKEVPCAQSIPPLPIKPATIAERVARLEERLGIQWG